MSEPQIREETESLYEVDFFEWTQSVAESLLHDTVSQTDLQHVAGEIADIGNVHD